MGQRHAKGGSEWLGSRMQLGLLLVTSASPAKMGSPSWSKAMVQVTVAQAIAQFSSLLDAVEAGEAVVITRRGKWC